MAFAPFGLLFTGLSASMAVGLGWVCFKREIDLPSRVDEWGWAVTTLAVMGIFGFVGVRMLVQDVGRGDAWMPVTTQILLGIIFLGCGLAYLEHPQELIRKWNDPEVVVGDLSQFLFCCALVMALSVTACLMRRRRRATGADETPGRA